MIELVRVHALDDAHLMGHGLKIRHCIRHPDTARAVLGKRPRGAHELRRAAGEGEGFAFHILVWRVLTIALHEFGLVVEDVQVGRTAGHLEVNYTLHLGPRPGHFGGKGIGIGRGGGLALATQKRLHGHGPDAELTATAEKLSARLLLECNEMWIHNF